MELYQEKPEAATKGTKTEGKEEPKNLLAGGKTEEAKKKWDLRVLLSRTKS